MAVALVLGCNGQDGTFLCRHLLRRGYSVVGIGREQTPRFSYEGASFSYLPLDLDFAAAELTCHLESLRPDLVFHVAAVHASAGQAQYEHLFQKMLTVNVGSMHVVLEYLRQCNPSARALYASSAKVFGAPLPARIDELTPRRSTCLYSITKNAAGDAIIHYRRTHGCLASQLYLFNHESELRPANFFIPKLASILVARLSRRSIHEPLATLDFSCDWGSADEYMDIAIDCLEQAPGEDFVLASGRCLDARDLAARLLRLYGLDQDALGSTSQRVVGQSHYEVDISKLQGAIHRTPQAAIETIIQSLVAKELTRIV